MAAAERALAVNAPSAGIPGLPSPTEKGKELTVHFSPPWSIRDRTGQPDRTPPNR